MELEARLLHRTEQSQDLADQSQNFVRIRGSLTKARLTQGFSQTGQRFNRSLSPQGEVNNLGRCVHAQREPIADAIGDDEFALAALVES